MGSLICTIVLDKAAGALIKIENADGKITQTVTMDGTTLTIKVEGDSATSTITQKADSIHIDCKEFLLNAETITCKSSKATAHESQDTMTLTSSKDMSLSTKANLTQDATKDVTTAGANVTVDAKSALKLSGKSASMAATAEAKVEGATLKLSGSGQAELSGGKVDVKAQGMLTAEASGIATLKGNMTLVQGSMVQLG